MATINPEANPVIVLSGGGTGGHITPILAVAHELKKLDSSIHTVYIGERDGKFKHLTNGNPDIDRTFAVRAGKFRRYHGESFLNRVFDLKTNLLNLRDLFYFLIGTCQAWWQLGRVRPTVVFLKGGFVGVPVGLAAALRGIPITTHDSDVIPGLANRIVSRWTRVHATALPAEDYPYPLDKVVQVGVLVEHSYKHITTELMMAYREQLDVPKAAQVLLVTGGSSGAQSLNEAVREIAPILLERFTNLVIIHQVGRGKTAVYANFHHERLHVLEFMSPMYVYMGAADVVVSRASANTIAELGIQGKAAIVVPSPYLAAGHQLANAARLAEQGATLVVQEETMYDPQQGLLVKICDLLENGDRRTQLGKSLHAQTIPNAAHRLAILLVDEIKP